MRDLALYDRDINFSGEIADDIVLTPEYGTSMSFQFYDDAFYTQDYFRKKVLKGFNNFDINFNLIFTNRTEKEAKGFVAVMEHLSTGFFVQESGNSTLLDLNHTYYPSGNNTVKINFPTGAINSNDANRGDDISIYKRFSGLSVINYSTKEHEGLFDIDLTLRTNREVPMRYWSGSSFLTSKSELSGGHNGQLAPHWGSLNTNQTTSWKKFDMVHWTGKVFNEDSNNSDETQNFYFAIRDYDSTFGGGLNDSLTSPNRHINLYAKTGGIQLWSKDFSDIFTPDDGVTFDQSEKLNHLKYKNSVLESQNLSKNKNLIENLTLNFSNRTDRETRALLFFLEKKGTRVPFKINLPQLYIRDKYFVVSNFNHTFVYKDVNDITVVLNEVVAYRDFIDSPMGFKLATEDGKPLITQKFTGSVAIPADQTALENVGFLETGLDQIVNSKFLVLEAAKTIREISGVRYLDEISGQETGAVTFELRWTNQVDPYYQQEFGEGDGGPDLDLNVIDPEGNLINRFTTSLYERQPGFSNDDMAIWGSGTTTGTISRGPEIIYYRDKPNDGTYTAFATLYNNIGMNQGIVDYIGLYSDAYDHDYFWRSQYRNWAGTVEERSDNGNITSMVISSEYIIDIKISGELVTSNTGTFTYSPAPDSFPYIQRNVVGDTGTKFYITI